MPKLKKPQIPFVRVQRLLLGYGLNARQLSEILGCSWRTAKRRLDAPESFTLAELRAVSRSGGIPMEEIRAAIMQ